MRLKWDRAVIWAALAVIVVAMLAGCERADAPTVPGQTLRDTSEAAGEAVSREAGVPIWVDPATGCQYVGYIGHGLTPRLDEQGQPICLKLQSPVAP